MIRLYPLTDPQTLFKEALGVASIPQGPPDYSKILYITPSSLRALAATKAFHRIMQESRTACYIPPDITTLSEFSKRLHSLYGFQTLISWPLTQVLISRLSGRGMGLSVLISGLIRDLKQSYPKNDAGELYALVINKMKDLNIPDSLMDSITRALDIFRLYQDSLDKKGLIDDMDLLKVCPEYIEKKINPTVTIIDSFYSPTRTETGILKALIERSQYCLISIPQIEGLDDITMDYRVFLRDNFKIDEGEQNRHGEGHLNFKYHPYDDIESEVEGMARHIKSLFITNKIKDLSDVVIAFPTLDKYRDIIGRVFYRYGIPVSIEERKSLAETRPFIDLSCMIQSICEDYPRLIFSQFLSSPYFKGIPSSLRSWIPALSLQSGIVSGKKSWLNFLSMGNERCDIKKVINGLPPESMALFESDSCSINSIKDLKRDIAYMFNKLSALERIKASSTLSTLSGILKNTLQELGFLDITTVEASSDMKKQLWKCLDRLSFLEGIVPSPLSLKEFWEYLWHILKNTYMEKDVDGVIVTDISGAFFLSFKKYIFLGGLTDEDMPGRDVDYILPDSVKRALGLPDLKRRIRLKKFFLEGIIRSSENVHLSYPLSEDEKRFLPSPFIYSGQSERESIPGIFSKEELLIRNGQRPLNEFLSEIMIRGGIPNFKGAISVTDIDSYRSCPRKFFIERVLNLTPPEIKEYDLEASVLGSLIHKVMERIIFEDLNELDLLKEKAIEVVEAVAKEKNIDPFWTDIIKKTFLEILPDIIKMETRIRGDGYSPFKVEERVAGEAIKGIRLKGKIDRIDRSDRGLAIIDYKTGSDTITCSKVMEGKEKLQLFLYAALLRGQGEEVNRVGIYSLRDIKVNWCPSKTRKNKTVSLEDMIKTSLRFLERSVTDLRKGVFAARPLDDSYYTCRSCHENPLCPYIQL